MHDTKVRKSGHTADEDKGDDQLLNLVEHLSGSMERLKLQQQAEEIALSLINKNQTSTTDEKSSTTNLDLVENYQNDEEIVLRVGGKYYHTTKKTIMGLRVEEVNHEMQDDIPTKNNRFEFVNSNTNLFKIMFESGFGITRDSETSAIVFDDRNPDYFDYILEHLRQGGRVKSLGIEKLNVDQLVGILSESEYFLTEKLSHYVTVLLERYHNFDSAFVRKVNDNQFSKHHPLLDKQSCQQHLINMDKRILETREHIETLAKQLVQQFKGLITEENESNLSLKINVGGQYFSIPLACLKKHENFLITKFISCEQRFRLNSEGCIFIDRNPTLFSLIHGYIVSDGQFYHIPKMISEEKLLQLRKEVEFYGISKMLEEYSDPLRYPIELLGEDNIQLKLQEDKLRGMFANDRDAPILDDPYLNLAPLFSKLDEIKSAEKYGIDPGSCPKILDLSDRYNYFRHSNQPILVNNLETFTENWYRFTQGVLVGLDWTGVFAAGGSILGCCLKNDPTEEANSRSTYYPDSLESKSSSIPNTAEPYQDEEEEEAGFTFQRVSDNYSRSYPFSEYQNYDSSDTYNKYIAIKPDRRKLNQKLESPFHTKSKNENSIFIPQPNIPGSFKKSDIDLFLYAMSVEEAEEKIRHIYQTIKTNIANLLRENRSMDEVFMDISPIFRSRSHKNIVNQPKVLFQDGSVHSIGDTVDEDILVVRTKYAVTFYAYKIRPIQVVLRIYKSPAEILLGFDVDCATLGWDGNQLWSSPRARRALMYKTNLVDVDRQSTTYDYRLYKYAKRGFSVSVPGYHHSKVNNQILHFPRRFELKYVEHLLHGLARLLLFDFACRSKDVKHILRIYDSNETDRVKIKEEKKIEELLGERNPKSDYFDLSLIKNERNSPKYIYEKLRNLHVVFSQKKTPENAQNTIPSFKSNFRHVERKPNDKPLTTILKEIDLWDLNDWNITQKKFHQLHSDKSWAPFFIYTLNDIESIILNTSMESRVSNRIEFITHNPGSQKMIGSFHSVNTNFYRDAYHQIPFSKLPIIPDQFKKSLWYKSMSNLPPENIINNLNEEVNKSASTRFWNYNNMFRNYRNNPQYEQRYRSLKFDRSKGGTETLWFELYTPEISNLIEHSFRLFVMHGHPSIVKLSETETIDFEEWKQMNTNHHPSEPNAEFKIHRQLCYSRPKIRGYFRVGFPSLY